MSKEWKKKDFLNMKDNELLLAFLLVLISIPTIISVGMLFWILNMLFK